MSPLVEPPAVEPPIWSLLVPEPLMPPAPVAVLSVPVPPTLMSELVPVPLPLVEALSLLWLPPQELSKQVPRARVSMESWKVCLRIKLKSSGKGMMTLLSTRAYQPATRRIHVIRSENP
jgi:hypothetical protein